MVLKTKIAIFSGIVLLAAIGLFFLFYNNTPAEQPAQNTGTNIAANKAGPNADDYFDLKEETKLGAETPLTITRQPLPDSSRIAQEIRDRKRAELEEYEKARKEDPQYANLPPLNPDLSNLIPKYEPGSSQPKPLSTPAAASPTPTKPLTDKEIFAIIYPSAQIDQLDQFQDTLIDLGEMKESERVVFDNETKIRDFVTKGMAVGCPKGLVPAEYCDNFNKLGIDAFFAQKKTEETLLRANGRLASPPLTLEKFYQIPPTAPIPQKTEYQIMLGTLMPGKKLTDQQIFAILYSPTQLTLLGDIQDELVLSGDIPENERVVFDNETKIRDFIVRAMAIGCPRGLIEKDFCVNFGQVGIGPFFALKKEEERSLRETGVLPKEPLSLDRFRKYVSKKTLSDILAYTAESQETVSEVFSGCPNPAKTSLDDIGKFSPSSILLAVKDFFTGKPAEAHKSAGGYCTYWWPHTHAYEPGISGCGYDLFPWTTPWPTEPVKFTPCCHCKVTKYCRDAGCIQSCGEWQQSLWDGMTGICGCGIFP